MALFKTHQRFKGHFLNELRVSFKMSAFQSNVDTRSVKNIFFAEHLRTAASVIYVITPLDWNSPCRGEGASHREVSTRVRQREELNWASQLKSSDQQIFSTMLGIDSPLIRQD